MGSGKNNVGAYFTAESGSWDAKYAPGGTMSGRLGAFHAQVAAVSGAGERLCDLGCGTGALLEAVGDLGLRVVGGDLSDGMLRAAARRGACAGTLAQLDGGTGLPFRDRAFQVVLSSSVLEYVPDARRYAAEVRRVLTPGGYWILTVPDMGHWIRSVESVERAVYAVAPWAGRRWAPMRSQYQAMSVNRWGLAAWTTMFGENGFVVRRVSRELRGLLLLTLRKDTNE